MRSWCDLIQAAQLLAVLDKHTNPYAPDTLLSSFVTDPRSPLPPDARIVIAPDVGTVGMHVSVAPPTDPHAAATATVAATMRGAAPVVEAGSTGARYEVKPAGVMCYPASRAGINGIVGNQTFRRLGWCTLRVEVVPRGDTSKPGAGSGAGPLLEPADHRYFHMSWAQIGWHEERAKGRSGRHSSWRSVPGGQARNTLQQQAAVHAQRRGPRRASSLRRNAGTDTRSSAHGGPGGALPRPAYERRVQIGT